MTRLTNSTKKSILTELKTGAVRAIDTAHTTKQERRPEDAEREKEKIGSHDEKAGVNRLCP
jgi:hypothetical protein